MSTQQKNKKQTNTAFNQLGVFSITMSGRCGWGNEKTENAKVYMNSHFLSLKTVYRPIVDLHLDIFQHHIDRNEVI